MFRKALRKLVLLILFVAVIASASVLVSGYEMYQDAVSDWPLSEKISEIQGKEHFTNYDELTQCYIDAVIAAEDTGFFGITALTSWRQAGRCGTISRQAA